MHSPALPGKPLVWLEREIRTPPLSRAARVEAGYFLRRLQQGEFLSLPHSRPMPVIGKRVHELRVVEANATWRIMYRTDPDAILILEFFSKKTADTPRIVIENCKRRLKEYDHAAGQT